MNNNQQTTFKYKSPTEDGYKKIKLTKKQHNKLFKYRQMIWYDKYDYYLKGDNIIIERTNNILFKIVLTLAAPFLIIVEGFKVVIPEYIREIKGKKIGAHTVDNGKLDGDVVEKINKGDTW